MAYVPVVLILAGMTAYTILAGADFGAGLWMLLSSDAKVRDHCRHAMGPVWEANHVWLIFVLVVCWTGYPVAFGSIVSTLSAPLLIAGIGIIFRGVAYALRGAIGPRRPGEQRLAENLLGAGSLITPFALGTMVGGIALGRVPVGNAAGNLLTSWLNPGSVLVGLLAVAFSAYLAAVYLAADAVRSAPKSTGPDDHSPERIMAAAFRTRALFSGLAAGALALAGLLAMNSPGLPLLRAPAVIFVAVSGAAGLGTMALCWARRFALARLTAAAAVATVVVGWTVAQAPRLLPGLTVTQAAAGQSTLVALTIAVGAGAVVLVPSLILLFTLYLRGRLDTPEHAVPLAPAGIRPPLGAHRAPLGPRGPLAGAVTGLLGGTVLLIFTDGGWEHIAGAGLLVLCAVSVFALSAPVPGSEPAGDVEAEGVAGRHGPQG